MGGVMLDGGVGLMRVLISTYHRLENAGVLIGLNVNPTLDLHYSFFAHIGIIFDQLVIALAFLRSCLTLKFRPQLKTCTSMHLHACCHDFQLASPCTALAPADEPRGRASLKLLAKARERQRREQESEGEDEAECK
eukprot:6206314-Pleurochrysis_carterae.AAC.2